MRNTDVTRELTAVSYPDGGLSGAIAASLDQFPHANAAKLAQRGIGGESPCTT